ncbi:MAG: L-aspartate oxidase [Methylocystaceae bacterium]|nr:MAG: L-aspartate oxidase [Methylocystaceae bacterium]
MSPPPILIIGGGLAGLFCALKLAPRRVAVLTPGSIDEGAASFWAQGGIAAAVLETDTPERHAEDTVKAGAGIVDAQIALGVAREARARVDDLLAFGVPFDRSHLGEFTPSREAAHSERRVVRVKGDTAGRAIMETLVRAARATPSIELVEGYGAQELLTQNDRVVGVRAHGRDGLWRDFLSPAVVLATGGIGHLYRVTTNPLEARGVGLAIAARAGASVADAEFVQFHPTAIDIGVDPAPLATESLRGEGAIIVDRSGHRFLADIDPAAELAPRDIVARGVFAAIADGRGAFLDARAAVGAEFPARFPTVYASCVAGGVDPVSSPIPIAPAAHYHMGGVATDARGRTSLRGLWAAGEVASTGVHGANRLASNSLLEAIVFAARIADDIGALSAEAPTAPPHANERAADALDQGLVDELRDVMATNVGVIRDRAGLTRAARAILRIEAATTNFELRNMAAAALLVAGAALARRESRGAHFRSDFPEPDAGLAQRSRLTLTRARAIAEETLLR